MSRFFFLMKGLDQNVGTITQSFYYNNDINLRAYMLLKQPTFYSKTPFGLNST